MSSTNRRDFIRLAGAGAAAISLPGLSLSKEKKLKKHKPYNFVLILADDLGAYDVGCYGSTKYHTLNIDSLAEQGMRFKTCFACPICTPSRAMLMTGRYGFRTGWYNFSRRPGTPNRKDHDIDLGDEPNFARMLKQAGYTTAIAGRWLGYHYEYKSVPKAGFDQYCLWGIWDNMLPPGVKHRGAMESLPQTEKQSGAAKGGGVTSRYWHPCMLRNGKYVPTKATDFGPNIASDFCIDFLREQKQNKNPFFLYYSMIRPHEPYPPMPDPERPEQKKESGLKASIEYTDHLAGKVVRELDSLGLAEDTIVMFIGDNGTNNSGKADCTERGARVPCIFRCPGTIPSGVISDELTDLSDILPTMAGFSGAQLPVGVTIDGMSLVPTLCGRSGTHREWIFSYLHDHRILRDKRWLLEGDGRFYDCGGNRDGNGYKIVTNSKDPEVIEARRRFDKILEKLPAPEGLEPDQYLNSVSADRNR